MLDYDPDTGVLTWRRRSVGSTADKIWNAKFAGCAAGTIMNKGYVHITIDREKYLGHVLAWVHFYGLWPPRLDHEDRVRNNNRIKNLREATAVQNAANRCGEVGAFSGRRGVHWHGQRGKWIARLMANGKMHYLGLFVDKEEAAAAYAEAAKRLQGDFAVKTY